MRVWRRLVPPVPPMDTQKKTPPPAAAAAAPAPRAYHVSWAFDNDLYVHGGEGPMGGARAISGSSEVDDIFGCVGRDPFAEEDGGAPLGPGRVATAATARSTATAPGSRFRKNGAFTDEATNWLKGRNERNSPPSRVKAGAAPRRPAVSVFEDLWKLDSRTLLWERVRVGWGGTDHETVCLARESCTRDSLLFGRGVSIAAVSGQGAAECALTRFARRRGSVFVRAPCVITEDSNRSHSETIRTLGSPLDEYEF